LENSKEFSLEDGTIGMYRKLVRRMKFIIMKNNNRSASARGKGGSISKNCIRRRREDRRG